MGGSGYREAARHDRGGQGRGRVLNIIKLLIVLIVMIFAAALAALNDGQVTLNYYFGRFDTSLPLALLGSLGVGLLLGFAAGLTLWVRARGEAARLRRRARLAQEEVNNLRAIPLKQQ